MEKTGLFFRSRYLRGSALSQSAILNILIRLADMGHARSNQFLA
jgi:hypothetical protein